MISRKMQAGLKFSTPYQKFCTPGGEGGFFKETPLPSSSSSSLHLYHTYVRLLSPFSQKRREEENVVISKKYLYYHLVLAARGKKGAKK